MVKNNIIFETSIISWKLCGCFESTTPMLLYLNPYLITLAPLLMSSYLLGFVNRNAQIRTCSLILNEPSHMSWMSITKFQSQLAKMDRHFSTLPRYQNIKKDQIFTNDPCGMKGFNSLHDESPRGSCIMPNQCTWMCKCLRNGDLCRKLAGKYSQSDFHGPLFRRQNVLARSEGFGMRICYSR